MTLVQDGSVTEHGLAAHAAETVPALLSASVAAVSAAAARLGQPGDVEALHDFRVAVRRFRSLLRAYRDLTDAAIPLRLRRRLRELARATNLSRDLEVKLGWLEGERAELKPRERTGERWLVERLTGERVNADKEALDLVARDLAPLIAALTDRLEDPPSTGIGAMAFARFVADLVREQTHELELSLQRVGAITDQEEAHDARIAGKRVRYLLEPLAATVPLALELVSRLKSMQDLLGDMHDADVAAHLIAGAMEEAAQERGKRVAERLRTAGSSLDTTVLRRERRLDPMPGLMALAQKVQSRREAAWTELERDWLPHAGPRLLEPLLSLAQSLDRKAPGDIEIERKYLLSGLPERVRSETAAEIDQGYLPGEKIHERLRRVASRGGTRWYRTVKLGAGVVRQEFEEQVAEELFHALWALTEGRRVSKRRYRIPDGQLVWEIDEFTDRDLVLAEVELPTADYVPHPPEWLANYLTRDVTDDAQFVNINLAK